MNSLLTNTLNRIYKEIDKLDHFDLVLNLTLIYLILNAPLYWYVRSIIIFLMVVGLIFKDLRTNRYFWLLVAAALGATVYYNWYQVDNHKYLQVYWALALFCVFSVHKDLRIPTLRFNARILIALVMGFATIWKLLSDSYMSGAFFEHTMLVDNRFEYFTAYLTDIELSILELNRSLEKFLQNGHLQGVLANQVELLSTDQVERAALIVTWTIFLFEGFISLMFFLPDNLVTARIRNILLIFFGIVTYVVATVPGFGWLLMILGLAQCKKNNRIFISLYILAYLLIILYNMPLDWISSKILQFIGL